MPRDDVSRYTREEVGRVPQTKHVERRDVASPHSGAGDREHCGGKRREEEGRQEGVQEDGESRRCNEIRGEHQGNGEEEKKGQEMCADMAGRRNEAVNRQKNEADTLERGVLGDVQRFVRAYGEG